ncbi:MAG: methyltransferase domain-containing protein [Spirochaetaceae bacterium]|nr:MAG: methyltransferase domain-containing protein [Spirochaetaceae bacterium]
MKRSKRSFIDNDFYDREAAYWWSDSESPLAIIRYMMNPIRFAYVIRQLVELSYDYRSRRVLDIGCGGGFLTEEIAGEELSFADNSFDMVFCLDVLEHVRDYRAVVSEISRVLVPGGFCFFETVNRTILSYLVVIFFMQEFPLTRVMPAHVHDWSYFIKPGELTRAIRAGGMRVEDMRGVLPGLSFVYNLPRLPRLVADTINFRDLCNLFRCHESIFKNLCYVGYALKPPTGRR